MQRLSFLIIVGLVLTLTPAFGQANSQPITVTIDGKPVVFNGTRPQEIVNAVMVPLRGVFQQMGATVAYDQPTHTIKAQAGATSISLPIGSSTATVNGQTETLTQPAVVVGGATLVPLRFVAESMGAYVEWNAAARSVKIVTPAAHLSTLPPPPATLGPTFIGQLIGIDKNTTPMRISLRDDQGETVALPISPTATFTHSYPGQVEVSRGPGFVSGFQTGYQISVTRDSTGAATDLKAIFGEVTGIVKSITANKDGSHTVNLTDGISVTLVPGAPVTMAGRRVDIGEVMAAEHVDIGTSQDNKTGYRMTVVTQNDLFPTPPGQSPPLFLVGPPGAHSQALPNGPGVILAADQAAPVEPPVDVAVTVDSFTASVSTPVKAGDKVSVTLKGTPGGKASTAIPGVLTDIPLPEERPGEYTGTLTIPKNVSVTGATIIGKLIGPDGTPSPIIPAKGSVTVDNTPPVIFDQTPSDKSTVAMARPMISAALSDGDGAGVDPGSVKVSIDGQDVTGQAQVKSSYVAYRPASPLVTGNHGVVVTAADKLGNNAKSEWNFRVAGPDQDPLTQTGSQPISGEHPLDLTLTGWPGSIVTFSVGSDPGQIPMKETQPGTYRALYSPGPGSGATRAAVVAQIKPAKGDPVMVTLGDVVPVLAPPPAKPSITVPPDGTPIEDSLEMAGSARPGQWVQVTISYSSRGVTGLFELDGNAASLAARADAKGHWKTENITLKLPWLLTADRVTRFTISAKAVDCAGQESEADTVRVMHE
jgi:hypothetical protein